MDSMERHVWVSSGSIHYPIQLLSVSICQGVKRSEDGDDQSPSTSTGIGGMPGELRRSVAHGLHRISIR